MPKLIAYYNLIISLVLTATGVASAQNISDGMVGLLFLPVSLYAIRKIRQSLHSKPQTPRPTVERGIQSFTSSTSQPRFISINNSPPLEGEEVTPAQVRDINKRLFLKLIGSAGLATFIFALFTKSSQAAFFGSVPGPGTVSLKDSSGNKIDPAEKQPTDGYEVTQMDDTTIPAYYGFVNKDGAWYIAKEGNGGEFRYTRGTSNFATSWTNRVGLAYNYFNEVF